MRIYFPYTILIAIMIMLAACKQRVTQEELIEAAIEIRLSQWREEQLQACKEKALISAEEYVDSLLVAISLESKLDTIPKPGKPSRPAKPPFKPKPDSVVVDPIYKKGQ